jgi:alpha-amylase
MSLAFLPDLKTESTAPSGLPNFYRHKPDTAAKRSRAIRRAII